jgi:hypothetical protein
MPCSRNRVVTRMSREKTGAVTVTDEVAGQSRVERE